ncbi:MAG: hypothetical protein KQI81_12450 [Deltaproteobacteria bacterium]|nr:hypothetical protein [Deltaproteobacteria bacterium]
MSSHYQRRLTFGLRRSYKNAIISPSARTFSVLEGDKKQVWDTPVDVTENYPSLVNCLENDLNGFFLDLEFPSGEQGGSIGSTFFIGPFSKTISGRIKTDGDGVIQHVILVLQRDHYDTPRSLLPVNNNGVETAWQNAFSFYQNSEPAKVPLLFKHQVNLKGEFEPLQPLFACHQTRRWFHPVCPQCGLALTLCRDDALLEKRGLPSYSESLERFLYCGSCATLSDLSPFYCLEKAAGMPDIVHGASALAVQWKQLLDKFPDDTDLPCRGCPDRDACYGPASLVSQRIVPFSFFPFYMMMFRAPSCHAAEFLPLISGDTASAPWPPDIAASPSGQNRFLFQDQDRQFLEILYLKLTFLEQLFRQLMPADNTTVVPEFDLSLEGIGVDLNPAGAGLPAFWNFNIRILDAVGTFQVSPFAPIMPEAPRFHFLGAVWFRTLLANSHQKADSVFTEVGRLLEQMDIEKGTETIEIETSDPAGAFAGNQIFWSPDQRNLPENWQVFWKKALRLGLQLVQAGLKTGVAWNGSQFLAALEDLREQVKSEMFSGPMVAAADQDKPAQADKIVVVLRGILKKWQAEADAAGSQAIPDGSPVNSDVKETIVFSPSTDQPQKNPADGLPTAAALPSTGIPDMPPQPLEDNGWEQDGEETVVLSSAQAKPPSEARQPSAPGPPLQAAQWHDDFEETVVMRTDAATPETSSPVDDIDQTAVISAPSPPPDRPLPGREDDLAATMIQHGSGAPPLSAMGPDEDLEETVILNIGRPPTPNRGTPLPDDDLAATMIQEAGIPRPSTPNRSAYGDDPDATMIINPASGHPPLNHLPEIPPGQADDELAATMIETPHSSNRAGAEQLKTTITPPTPPVPPQPSRDTPQSGSQDGSGRVAPVPANDDDDIMEQTIIIRSDVKKE